MIWKDKDQNGGVIDGIGGEGVVEEEIEEEEKQIDEEITLSDEG